MYCHNQTEIYQISTLYLFWLMRQEVKGRADHQDYSKVSCKKQFQDPKNLEVVKIKGVRGRKKNYDLKPIFLEVGASTKAIVLVFLNYKITFSKKINITLLPFIVLLNIKYLKRLRDFLKVFKVLNQRVLAKFYQVCFVGHSSALPDYQVCCDGISNSNYLELYAKVIVLQKLLLAKNNPTK